MKKCATCKLDKELIEFHKCKTERDGYKYSCKECILGHKPHIKPLVEKICIGCDKLKSIEEFGFTSREKNLRLSRCKKCRNKISELQLRNNPIKKKIKNKRRDLRKKYNISLTEYNTMVTNQNSKCLVCPREIKGSLCVDHCHESGKIRGLLCSGCNSALGFAGDNIKILQGLINYLQMSNTFKSS